MRAAQSAGSASNKWKKADYAYAKIGPPAAVLILLNLRNLTLIALLVALVWGLPRLLTGSPLAPQNGAGRAAA